MSGITRQQRARAGALAREKMRHLRKRSDLAKEFISIRETLDRDTISRKNLLPLKGEAVAEELVIIEKRMVEATKRLKQIQAEDKKLADRIVVIDKVLEGYYGEAPKTLGN
jgi:hypothetical protein